MRSRLGVGVTALVAAVAGTGASSVAASTAAATYRVVGQPVVLHGVVATSAGPAYGNVLIFRVNRKLPEGSNHAVKAVAQINKASAFSPSGDSAAGWGLVHASRHGVACYSEDLGHETRLPGEKNGRVTFFVTARGVATPFAVHAKVTSTKNGADISVPIASSAAKKLGC
jgi:hypothetical protein